MSDVCRNFPFIIGSGRSGTTLLRAMLDSHPKLAIPFESYFVTDLAMVRDRYTEHGAFDAEYFMADLFGYYRFHRWGIPEGDVRASFNQDPPRDFPQAIRDVYMLYARAQGKNRYGDKTPRYIMHVPLLAEVFPESSFVHIIRDGRNVTLSYLEMEWGPGSLVEAAQKWTERVQSGRKAGRALEPERYTEIFYEDFVENPEDEIGRICDFLELDFHPNMLRYHERADEIRFGTNYPHRHQHLSKPPTKDLRDWRRTMSAEDLATFEAIAGDLLRDLGYQTGTGVKE